MKCPNCDGIDLRPVLTRQGVEVEYCDSCQGVWLDRGELSLFSRDPGSMAEKLEKAMEKRVPTLKPSPRTGQAMEVISYPGGPQLNHCPDSGGLWFDGGELRSILKAERSLNLDLDPASAASGPAGDDSGEAKRHAQIRAGMLALPNLFVRSVATLIGLYAILGLVLITIAEFGGVGVPVAVGVFAVIIQFTLGPFIMDLSLRWLYRMEWVAPARLPNHLRRFVKEVSNDKNIRFPSFGIIDDGAPQAFTYGHRPNNARIVISRGLLEILDEDEAEAVVAHEMGHAIHWDMFLMTIAQLVPLLLYYIFRATVDSGGSKSGNKKGGGGAIYITIAAYILYIVSEYAVLWFSRTREYHADRFAGEVTNDPSALAAALVKIAYGLAGRDPKTKEKGSSSRSSNLEAIGALGIFDSRAARSLAITSYSAVPAELGDGGEENLKGAMRWDMWNPWAKWYELNSTHPLVANRLRYLSDQAVQMGREPYVVFDEVQPESYWDEFLFDLGIYLLPGIVVLFLVGSFALPALFGADVGRIPFLIVALLGGAMWTKFRFSYRGGVFPEMSVAAVLKKVKVSAVRGVPCKLKGTVIGKGVPGLIFSEDFVMRDDTGIIFLDYRQPLGIWEFFFGLMKAGQYQGEEVIVEGWYRRSPVPYIEIASILTRKDKSRSWIPFYYKSTAILVAITGLALFLLG